MRNWLKGALLSTSVFGSSWVGAVSYWRATNRMPSTLDVFVWLAALPLALLLAFWLARRMLAAREAQPTAPSADTLDAAPAAPPALPVLAILAAAVRTPHGASAQELAQAAEEGRARAGLDPELVDDDGFPLMSARAPLDDLAAVRADLDTWRSSAGLADARFSKEQWRALALGTAVASELLMQANGAQLATLRIHAVLGPDWDPAQRELAAAWLAALATQAGWPAQQIEATSPALSAPGLLAQLADQGGSAAIVLSFGSCIGDAGVQELARQGVLFGPANAQGLIPGEAAAGLLVAAAAPEGVDATALQLASAPPAANDGGRKPEAASLRALAERLLPGADQAASVSAVFADTGHRSIALLELMKFTGAAVPHLDSGDDVTSLGAACGYAGPGAAAPWLAALALAHQHALDTAGAALCVGNEDPSQRTAALVRPGTTLT